MRRALATLFIAAATLTAAVPLGVADTVRGTDPSGDTEGGGSSADLVRATAGTDSRGRLVHTVSVAGNAASPSGDGIVPVVYIEIPDQANAVAECTVFVGVYRGKQGVYRCGTTERLGSATITRTSAHTFRYTFSPKALGKPKYYDWAVVTRSNASTQGSWTRYDRLPSGDDIFLSYKR